MVDEKSSTPGLGAKVLKSIGIITAIISLVLGIRQIVNMVQDSAARKNKAEELRTEAEHLASNGDYSRAWQSISQATELRPEYRNKQVDVAMQWLRDIRIAPNRGERTFTEITEKLLPVLYGAIDSSRKEYSATVFAHIGWANYLMFKEGDRGVKVDEQFLNALRLDSTNLFANTMYGFWILYPGHGVRSIEKANRHFAAALRYGKDTNYVRYMAISAYGNVSTPEYQAQIIGLANQMRKNHETMESPARERIVMNAYYMYSGEIIDEVGKLLTPQDHLNTFLYLTEGTDVNAKPYLKDALVKLKKLSNGGQ